MFYKFRCQKCNKLHQVDIKMADYDKEKDNQVCPECNGKMERVIEWQGIATGSGPGWSFRCSCPEVPGSFPEGSSMTVKNN